VQSVPPTPYLTIDLGRVRENFQVLRAALPGAEIRYAVKANPAGPILRLLAGEGAAFDVASAGEIDGCAACDIEGHRLTFGNPIKKASDVAYSYARGVRRFVVDTEDGVRTVAEQAPGSAVECRVALPFPPSVTPFGDKFGCAPADAARLLGLSRQLGLFPEGLAFHVGSQQRDPRAWELGIRCAAEVFDTVAELTAINAGGGFPIGYTADSPGIEVIAEVIVSALRRHFGSSPPQLVVEPGRAIVGSAGTLRCEVVSVRAGTDGRRWVYLDVGRYGGLAETENEYIRYRLRTHRDADPLEDAVVAGPTCDGDDVLYRRYPLPVTLRAGDPVEIDAAGAYTASYASSCFNGFPPLPMHFVDVTPQKDLPSPPGSQFAGCHVLAEFRGVDTALADDPARLRGLLHTALERAGATVCEIVDKRFEPHGVTVLALLEESHASIHSYPERGAMFVDVFTCGEQADAQKAVVLLREELEAADACVRTVLRGSGTEFQEIIETIAPGLTRNWRLSGVLCDVHTDFQHVVIGRTEQGVALFTDAERQSTEFSQLVYHEALLVPALLLADRIERVLVIGSGEGVVSQLAVAAGATRVDHVDIDPQAVRLCAQYLPYGYTVGELRRAEQGLGPVKVHYCDGADFVDRATGSYDVVVVDLPDERADTAQHNRLYEVEFLQRCRDIGGVVVGQAGCPTLWRNDTLYRSWQRFRETFGTVVYFGSDEHEWAFLSGTREKQDKALDTMTAKLDTLPYRPRTIDAQTLRGCTVPPRTLRVR
jgi:spermidine synthase